MGSNRSLLSLLKMTGLGEGGCKLQNKIWATQSPKKNLVFFVSVLAWSALCWISMYFISKNVFLFLQDLLLLKTLVYSSLIKTCVDAYIWNLTLHFLILFQIISFLQNSGLLGYCLILKNKRMVCMESIENFRQY